MYPYSNTSSTTAFYILASFQDIPVQTPSEVLRHLTLGVFLLYYRYELSESSTNDAPKRRRADAPDYGRLRQTTAITVVTINRRNAYVNILS